MERRLGATFTLIGTLAAVPIGEFALNRLPNPVAFLATSGPRFRVEYGYFPIPSLDCPGGVCEPPASKRLKIQSREDQPIRIDDVVVNGRPECTDFSKLSGPAAFGALVAKIAVPSLKGSTMNYGDVRFVLSLCEPLDVKISTERGESTYRFE